MWTKPIDSMATHCPASTFVLLDAGNTDIKWCTIQAHELAWWLPNGNANAAGWHVHRTPSHNSQTPDNATSNALRLAVQAANTQVLLCSVLQTLPPWLELPNQTQQLKCTQHHIANTLHTQYQNPKAWGPDRFAQVLAVHVQCQQADWIKADCAHVIFGFGTATTWDILIPSETAGMQIHTGGGIAPGFASALHCMHAQTSRLPLPNAQLPPDVLSHANNTEEGMILGAMHAQLGLVHSVLNTIKQQFTTVHVHVCGGFASGISALLMPQLSCCASVNVMQHAVLQGLCAAWQLFSLESE